MDTVRVLRIIEYVGPRDRVEETIATSVHGTRNCGRGLFVRAATIGSYPELLTNIHLEMSVMSIVERLEVEAKGEAEVAEHGSPVTSMAEDATFGESARIKMSIATELSKLLGGGKAMSDHR